MGSDHLTTELGAPYARQPETLAAALRYLERSGNADVAEVLGLTGPPVELPEPPGDCPICGNRLPSHGVCRRREACRAVARERGESA